MTHCYIIQKAIAKAQENGFEPVEGKHKLLLDTDGDIVEGYETFIFDENFAKAFFGEKVTCHGCGAAEGESYLCFAQEHMLGTRPRWKFDLQQMVVSDDPFAYLEKYL